MPNICYIFSVLSRCLGCSKKIDKSKMRLLIIGVGGVGEAVAVMAANKPWIEVMVLAGRKLPRLLEVQARLGNKGKYVVRLTSPKRDYISKGYS